MMGAPEKSALTFAASHAARLWTRRHSGTWTETEEAELQQWLAADSEHRSAYEKVSRVWAVLGEAEGRVPRIAAVDPSSRRRVLWTAAASLVLLILGAGWLSYNWWYGKSSTWSAQRGEPRRIVLADGTQIVLDADSELETRIGAHARRVTLRHGEALLTVVHDAARPFVVEVGRGRITDLGTRFDVENLQGRARISVLEGRVGVETARGSMLLEAGRAGGYEGDGTLFAAQEADRSVELWLSGQRHFNADRLADVLQRLTRYHAVTFTFSDPRLQELRVSGTFRTADLSLFLRTLQAALPIEVRWLDPQRIEIGSRVGARPE